jgi:hypothetical protein
VLSAAVHLIPYAVIATLSPLGFAATITVMRSGRLKAIGFALGVVLGQLLACAVLVAVGAIATPDRSQSHQTVEGLLEMGLAIVLLSYASVVYRRPETPRRPSSRRSKTALERLERVHVATASAVGCCSALAARSASCSQAWPRPRSPPRASQGRTRLR